MKSDDITQMTRPELEDEINRLNKVINALIDHNESINRLEHSQYGVFRSTLMLEQKVKQRTLALRSAMKDLESAKRKFSAIFNMIPNPVLLISPDDGIVLDANKSFADFFDLRVTEIRGKKIGSKNLEIFPDGSSRRELIATLKKFHGVIDDYHLKLKKPDGRITDTHLSTRLLSLNDTDALIVQFYDISESLEKEDQMRKLAEHDVLTGLPNRKHVIDKMNVILKRNDEHDYSSVVAFLDVDGLKGVNDRFGHNIGDLLLQEISERFKQCLRADDVIGRQGGDEFVIVMEHINSENICRKIFSRIINRVGEPYLLDGISVKDVGISIGYTLYPEDYGSPEDLLDHADQAMYEVKRNGKNNFRRYIK